MNIEIYFVGGTVSQWTDVPKETINNLVRWLDNKEDTTTFKVEFTKHKKITYLRKELILLINIIE
ncbi:hypothetical protein [Clostridium sp.]|uniref:hypothetical protein n=1 Tax=Clostridium sp. TaxID=1506 RepID=UPI0032174831